MIQEKNPMDSSVNPAALPTKGEFVKEVTNLTDDLKKVRDGEVKGDQFFQSLSSKAGMKDRDYFKSGQADDDAYIWRDVNE